MSTQHNITSRTSKSLNELVQHFPVVGMLVRTHTHFLNDGRRFNSQLVGLRVFDCGLCQFLSW